mgnify:CR=1 FL=1
MLCSGICSEVQTAASKLAVGDCDAIILGPEVVFLTDTRTDVAMAHWQSARLR